MLSGATRLHEVGSYVFVVAFTSPPLLVADSTPFFPTNRLATRLNPTSSGRITLLFLSHWYALKVPSVHFAAQR